MWQILYFLNISSHKGSDPKIRYVCRKDSANVPFLFGGMAFGEVLWYDKKKHDISNLTESISRANIVRVFYLTVLNKKSQCFLSSIYQEKQRDLHELIMLVDTGSSFCKVSQRRRNSMTKKKKPRINRTFKSTVFIMLFEDKRNLLELYNAMTGKDYQDPDQLEINTLENAIYMSMKNDVSFIIDGRLSLYEHQSTYSPNLPLRFLFYVSDLYSAFTQEKNLYSVSKIMMPTPNFIIFYNGQEEMPERKVLKLSDLYVVEEEKPMLELEAVMLNIRGHNNEKLKDACQVLKEYAIYTDLIREYVKEGLAIDEAVDAAIEECLRNGVLQEFLEKNRGEAMKVSIYEYDAEKHMKMEREEFWEKGRQEGLEEGRKEGQLKGKEENILEYVRRGIITPEFGAEELHISVEELEKRLESR